MEFRRATLDEQPDARPRRAARARDLPAAAPAGLVRRGPRLPAVRPADRPRHGRRARPRLLERDGAAALARRLPRPVRLDAAAPSGTRPPMRVKAADGSKRLVRRSLAEGLGLPNEAGAFVIFRDARTGLESIRSCRELWEHGLHLSLDAYEAHVYWEFREVHDGVAGSVGPAGRAARRDRRAVARRGAARAAARTGPRPAAGRCSPAGSAARSSSTRRRRTPI